MPRTASAERETVRLLRRRLAAQWIARPAAPRDPISRSSPAAQVVEWLTAVQAQDYASALWAIALRQPGGGAAANSSGAAANTSGAAADSSGAAANTSGAAADSSDVAAVERDLDSGAILRLHAMRGTWQLIVPADVRWILALAGPRVRAGAERRHEQLGLSTAALVRSGVVLGRALAGGEPLTRAEITGVLEAAGIPARGPRLSHILAFHELDGLLCSGPRRGKHTTHQLLEHRAPAARAPLPADEAAAELARRYFFSRGPATLDDFVWWSGLTVPQAKGALAAVASELVSEVVGDRTYYRRPELSTRRSDTGTGTYLLPAFDEYVIAYRRRDAAFADPQHATRVNAGGGVLSPCVVIDGRITGTWKRIVKENHRTRKAREVAIELAPFARLGASEERAVHAAAGRYAAALGLRANVSSAR